MRGKQEKTESGSGWGWEGGQLGGLNVIHEFSDKAEMAQTSGFQSRAL